MCEPAAQSVGRDEVDEGPLAVDLDDREQLPVPSLELRVAVDRDFFQLEAELLPELRDRIPRTLAEVAPLRAVEPNDGYG